MTAIYWIDKKLYADSTVIKDNEHFQSLTKIRKLLPSFEFTYEVAGIQSRDVALGYVCSGSMHVASRLIQELVRLQDIDLVISLLNAVKNMGIFNLENHFNLIIIGQTCNHSIDVNVEEPDAEIRHVRMPHEQMFFLGTGGTVARQTIMDYRARCLDLGYPVQKPDPLRLMYSVYEKDEFSGGMIDVWGLYRPEDHIVHFERIGLCDAKDPELDEMGLGFEYLSTPREIDYLSRSNRPVLDLPVLTADRLREAKTIVEGDSVYAKKENSRDLPGTQVAGKQENTGGTPSEPRGGKDRSATTAGRARRKSRVDSSGDGDSR